MRRIEPRRQRRHRRLRRVHERAGDKHRKHQKSQVAADLADCEHGHGGQRIADRNDAVTVEAVHQPAEQNGADAAEWKQCRDQRRRLRIDARVSEEDRHPVDQCVEDDEAHEVCDP